MSFDNSEAPIACLFWSMDDPPLLFNLRRRDDCALHIIYVTDFFT